MAEIDDEALLGDAKDSLNITTYKETVSFLSKYFKVAKKTILDI